MKLLRQFSIILLFSFLGEILYLFIPLPIPASVCGLLLMFAALCTGILKLEIMPVMFIPADVGLLDAWPVLQPIWIPVMLITFLTTIIVMAVTGQVTQRLIRKERAKNTKRS